MFENARRGRQARIFTTNVPKILDLKSSSEQILFRKLTLGAPVYISKLSQISLAYRLVKLRITILKSHPWYLCQISLQIMLLPIHMRLIRSLTLIVVVLFIQLVIKPNTVAILWWSFSFSQLAISKINNK